MQAFILFCGFLSVSLAFQCYSDLNLNGQAPTSFQAVIDCADGCKYCAKITGKLKDSKKTISVWGCGCGGDEKDIAGRDYACTTEGTRTLKDDAGDMGKLYCCDKEKLAVEQWDSEDRQLCMVDLAHSKHRHTMVAFGSLNF
ncbi:unnamed protein product, partial [Mesorhabditis belari]|uniref:Uncharacterized protein n=1 Tax=Mesorhabditis belari TaxID=2138241 RepID=A0AAF3FLE2_9BILA